VGNTRDAPENELNPQLLMMLPQQTGNGSLVCHLIQLIWFVQNLTLSEPFHRHLGAYASSQGWNPSENDQGVMERRNAACPGQAVSPLPAPRIRVDLLRLTRVLRGELILEISPVVYFDSTAVFIPAGKSLRKGAAGKPSRLNKFTSGGSDGCSLHSPRPW
jgi:hypothetical protein